MPKWLSANPALQASIEEYLKAHHSSEPLDILVIGHNNSDGLGDFVHIYNAYKLLVKLFADNPHVRVNGICFIDKEKSALSSRIYEDEFKQYPIVKIDAETTPSVPPGAIPSGSFVLCECSLLISCDLNYADHAQIVINVSLQLQGAPRVREYLEKIKNSNTRFFSVSEYGSSCDTEMQKIDLHSTPSQSNISLYEIPMGVLSYQAGIEIDQELVQYSHEVKDHLSDLIASTENKALFQKMMGDHRTPAAYRAHTVLGCGYLQFGLKTNNFIILSVNIARSKNIDVFVNHSFFVEVDKEDKQYKIPEDLLSFLKDHDVSKVIFLSNEGEEKTAIILKDTATPRVLRLFHFHGTTNHDKKILFAIADCVSGSGDNSISEVISARNLPFFAVPRWKQGVIYQILGDIMHCFPHFTTLIHYLSCQNDSEYLVGSVEEDYEDAKKQWQVYCDYLTATPNKYVSNYLSAILEGVMIDMIDQMGSPVERRSIEPFSSGSTIDRELFELKTNLWHHYKQPVLTDKVAFFLAEDLSNTVASVATEAYSSACLKRALDTVFFENHFLELIPIILGGVHCMNVEKIDFRNTEELWFNVLLKDTLFRNAIYEKLDNLKKNTTAGHGLFPPTVPITKKEMQLLGCVDNCSSSPTYRDLFAISSRS